MNALSPHRPEAVPPASGPPAGSVAAGHPRSPRWALGPSRRGWIAASVPASLLVVALLLGGPGAFGMPAPSTAPAPSGPTAVANNTPFVRHVVEIVLENQGTASMWGHAPYERYLAANYGNATHFFAACHPSIPNYLAMIAAVTNQCGSDAWHNDTNHTLGDLLRAAGDSWAQYAENLPISACPHPASATSGLFATRHVPFLYFRDVLVNQSFCRQHILAAKQFTASVVNGTLPNYSLYTPNLCNDGHTGCGNNTTSSQLAAQADTWLHNFLSPILNHTGVYNSKAERKLIRHTLFIVTWDEGSGSGGYVVTNDTQFNNYLWCSLHALIATAVCGGQVYCVFVSPFSVHTTFTPYVSDYSLARTVEWLFHLPHLGNAGAFDARAAFPAMTTLFNFTANGH